MKGKEMELNDILTTLIVIIAILVIYYMTYSQRKKQEKELKKMQDELKKGDKIITYSGIAGVINKIEEDRVIIETYPDKIKISVEKWAIAGLDDRNIK